MIFCDKERIIKKMFNSFNLVRFVYNTQKNDNISIYNLNTFFEERKHYYEEMGKS